MLQCIRAKETNIYISMSLDFPIELSPSIRSSESQPVHGPATTTPRRWPTGPGLIINNKTYPIKIVFPGSYDMMQKFIPEDRNLRLITLLGFLPASSLLLAHGITTSQAFPALTTIPMALSSLTALVIIAKKIPPSQFLALWDVVVGMALVAFLVPSFVSMAERSSHHWNGNGIAPVTLLGRMGLCLL